MKNNPTPEGKEKIIDKDEEMRLEFVNNKEKYAIPKKIVQRWVCRSCGRIHRFQRGYAFCKVNKEANKILGVPEKDLPMWIKEGTREDICENYRWVGRWMWGWLQARIIKRDNWVCQDCGKSAKKDMHLVLEVHHILPRIAGGSDNPKNLKTLCVGCHRKYTNHLLGNKSAYNENQRSLA